MDRSERRAALATPIVLLIAAGLAFAGSRGGVQLSGVPLFALCVGLAFLVQWLFFLPSYAARTEKYYDLAGGITYLAVTVVSLIFAPALDFRGLLLGAVVSVWAIRLSTFLFRRVRAVGEDRRFRELKQSFWRFLLAWTTQGLWVVFSLAAALAAITSTYRASMGWIEWTGFAIWGIGFAIELIADRQKSHFKADPANKGHFIDSGLWARSRHPNYFGEILLWVGVAFMAGPVLRGWQVITLLSPVFVYLLLTRISGIPILERLADERWGGQPDYEAYKARTPVLFPTWARKM